MKFVLDDNMSTKLTTGESYLPARRLIIPVDKQKVLASGTVQPKDSAKIVDNIVFEIKDNVIGKSDLAMLDLLQTTTGNVLSIPHRLPVPEYLLNY